MTISFAAIVCVETDRNCNQMPNSTEYMWLDSQVEWWHEQ